MTQAGQCSSVAAQLHQALITGCSRRAGGASRPSAAFAAAPHHHRWSATQRLRAGNSISPSRAMDLTGATRIPRVLSRGPRGAATSARLTHSLAPIDVTNVRKTRTSWASTPC
jgi:hypothetical protein